MCLELIELYKDTTLMHAIKKKYLGVWGFQDGMQNVTKKST